MLVFQPNLGITVPDEAERSEVIICLDCSNSMEGETFLQAKQIALHALSCVGKEQKVNVIKFGTSECSALRLLQSVSTSMGRGDCNLSVEWAAAQRGSKARTLEPGPQLESQLCTWALDVALGSLLELGSLICNRREIVPPHSAVVRVELMYLKDFKQCLSYRKCQMSITVVIVTSWTECETLGLMSSRVQGSGQNLWNQHSGRGAVRNVSGGTRQAPLKKGLSPSGGVQGPLSPSEGAAWGVGTATPCWLFTVPFGGRGSPFTKEEGARVCCCWWGEFRWAGTCWGPEGGVAYCLGCPNVLCLPLHVVGWRADSSCTAWPRSFLLS